MSKRLKEVIAKAFHVSFLETIEADHNEEDNRLTITIQEIQEDGSHDIETLCRYVKVSHAKNHGRIYEIELDRETMAGTIHIYHLPAGTIHLIQVDETGKEMGNESDMQITYLVDEEIRNENGVHFAMELASCVEIGIINVHFMKSDLELFKIMRSQDKDAIDITRDMEFHILICDMEGNCQNVCLDQANDFHFLLENLPCGEYHIEEEEMEDVQVFYRLNFGSEQKNPSFLLEHGHNALEIINEICSNTSIHIAQYVRKANNELCRSSSEEASTVCIRSSRKEFQIELNRDNQFCITLNQMPQDFYEIQEEMENCDFETSYIMNGREQCGSLSFKLCAGNQVQVMIVHSEITQNVQQNFDHPLRICKYIRRCDGSIVMCDSKAQFKVMLRGCGIFETFLLNANNNFCVDIADLCTGVYEIREKECEDYTTTYIVNDDIERTSARVCIEEGCANMVSIINEERNKGSVRVCKFIRNEFDELCKPDVNQSFSITLRSAFCKHNAVLHAKNDWCACFHDLRFGSYEVREENDTDGIVLYQINGGSFQPHARFVIDGCCDNEIRLISSQRREHRGVLRICKYEEGKHGDLVKPLCDEEFIVEVSAFDFHECYTLRASNSWCVLLEGLRPDEYLIREQSVCDYNVTYVVNKEVMMDAIVNMCERDQEVMIINHRKSIGQMKISAVIRDCDGQIHMPSENQLFPVLIEGKEESLSTCLRCENGWCIILDQLPADIYRIIQKDNLGYRVRYQIQDEEQSFAKVALQGDDIAVTIVNEESHCAGEVIVKKFMADADGHLFLPDVKDDFLFELKGRNFANTYKLHEQNDFSVFFDDLEMGSYQIIEVGCNHSVRYRINQKDCMEASFVLGNEPVAIDIINEMQENGSICIQKRLCVNDVLVCPDPGDCFQILLKGKNVHEIFKLHYENDFSIELHDLIHQHYEICELHDSSCLFEINGKRMDQGYFLFDGSDIAITLINVKKDSGCMEIVKRIADESGELVRPYRWECFDAIVESDDYKQKITLDSSNDFCVKLYNLPHGHYEVREASGTMSESYEINGLPCERAIIDLVEEDFCITIINHPYDASCIEFQGCLQVQDDLQIPDANTQFHLIIYNDKQQYTCTLDEQNEFLGCLTHLPSGTYKITESGSEEVHFEIEGQSFKDTLCIDVAGEHVVINVVKTRNRKGDLTVERRVMDEDGNPIDPKAEERFSLCLLHKNEKECFELNAENDWTKMWKDLDSGDYEIIENSEHDIRFQLHNDQMSERGCFVMDGTDISIRVFGMHQKKGMLHLNARMEDHDGRLVMPSKKDMLAFLLDHVNMHRTLLLHHENQFYQKRELEPGMYLLHRKEQGSFPYYYLIDKVKTKEAQICMQKEDIHVTYVQEASRNKENESLIRNQIEGQMREETYIDEILQDDLSSINAYFMDDVVMNETFVSLQDEDHEVNLVLEEQKILGSVEICFMWKDEKGYRYPNNMQYCTFQIRGNQVDEQITLNKDNHFRAQMQLANGSYSICDIRDDMDVSYVVNHRQQATTCQLQIMDNANVVNIIYHDPALKGSIHMEKMVQDGNGSCFKAVSGRYKIHISKPGYQRVIELNENNHYETDIEGLANGDYVISQLDENPLYYRVDKGSCVDIAIVSVKNDAHTVEIMHEENAKMGSISAALYIREQGRLRHPKASESFVIRVSKPNFNQFYTLHNANDFQVSITDLKDGNYVISEAADKEDVSYVINGGSECAYGIISLHKDAQSVLIIINRGEKENGIVLDKFMRVDNRLEKPSADHVYTMRLSGCGVHDVYTLDVNNNWRYHIKNLENGMYVVNEMPQDDRVHYIVDGGSECVNAIIHVNDNIVKVMIINELQYMKGSIRIEKWVEEEKTHQLISPDKNDRFQILVSKPGYHETFLLHHDNNFTIIIENLLDGYYVISEMDMHQQVSFIINDGSECANGIVLVNHDQNHVKMINHPHESLGSIEFTKSIRLNDRFHVPAGKEERFVLQVRGEQVYRVVLTNENHWTYTLSDLPFGSYEIEELETSGYRASYVIDGKEESTTAILSVNGHHRVNVINTKAMTYGTLDITKFIRQGNGELIRPANGDEFEVAISGSNDLRQVVLNYGNDFTIHIDDLVDGIYQVKENVPTDMVTSYRVNHEAESDKAIITMRTGIQNVVDIINERKEDRNTIEVFKYMLDASDNYLPPQQGDIFHFVIIGNMIHDTYELNASNEWHRTLTNYPSGSYQIQEVGSPFPVQYLVNSATLSDEARFEASSSKTNIIGIINKLPQVQNGRMQLLKRVRGANGSLQEPNVDEAFVVHVHSASFDQYVSLDDTNRFMEILENLPYDTYSIVETNSSYEVSYQIDQEAESNEGRLQIQSDEEHMITIINTQTAMFFHMNNSNDIKVVIT